MANEKNITTVRDEDKSFIRVIMSLPPEKKNLIQGIIIGLDLQEKQTATAARQAASTSTYSQNNRLQSAADVGNKRKEVKKIE